MHFLSLVQSVNLFVVALFLNYYLSIIIFSLIIFVLHYPFALIFFNLQFYFARFEFFQPLEPSIDRKLHHNH